MPNEITLSDEPAPAQNNQQAFDEVTETIEDYFDDAESLDRVEMYNFVMSVRSTFNEHNVPTDDRADIVADAVEFYFRSQVDDITDDIRECEW